MMKILAMVFVGFAGGAAVATAVFAFIMLIGVLTKLVTVTKTQKHAMMYEDIVVFGGLTGCLLSLFQFQIPLGDAGACVVALLAGMFVGVLALCLAEVLSAVPILSRRIKIKEKLPIIVLCFTLGKCMGALIQFYYM